MKLAIIMCGIPGSGKSTLTNKLTERFPDLKIHSTDNYHFIDGQYVFQVKKLGYFHRLNLEAFCKDVDQNIPVVCDNTNTKRKEYKKYVEYAESKGYQVVTVFFYPDELEKHLTRNVHNVPMEALDRMRNTLLLNKDGHNYYIYPDKFEDSIWQVVNNIGYVKGG